MADITISDLELAPALADDMVLAVENTTDTYAATLEMLRRLLNKTFVEVENADFNALTDDGFYQCTGTQTNSPVAGAINWTLQVSAESGVVVQRAFSLDDNFANLYIRRWNGVTWTGWLDVGKGALDNKANVSNTVTTDTFQTITASKKISTGGTNGYSRPFEILMPTSTESNPTENKTREIAFLSSKGTGNNYEGGFIHTRSTTGESYTGLRAGRLVNGTYEEGALGVRITTDGTTFGRAPTPSSGAKGNEIVTAEWFKKSNCSIRTIVEAYGTNEGWYRIWNDGWVEQGGYVKGPSPNITFLKPFTNEGYSFIKSIYDYGPRPLSGSPAWSEFQENNRTKSGISLFLSLETVQAFWYACGY